MKKLLALILALMMTVCLFAACGEEEAEAPAADTTVPKEVTENATKALDLLVAQNQEELLKNVVDPDPTAAANSSFISKLTAYAAVPTNFATQVEAWGLADDVKAEVNKYAETKAADLYRAFKANGVKSSVKSGEIVTVNAKAALLNVTGEEYSLIYSPANMAKYTGVEYPTVADPAAPTEEETAAIAAADAEVKAKLAAMTIDELKVVTDNVFEALKAQVVDTDVAFQYKKIDKDWKINYIGISAAE